MSSKILIKINDLLDAHNESIYICPGCHICTEIELLRPLLTRGPEERFKHILAKGSDMSTSEMLLLLESGIEKHTIWSYLNDVTRQEFYYLLAGLKTKKETGEVDKDMVRKKEVSKEDYLALGHISDREKAEVLGLAYPTLARKKGQWGLAKPHGKYDKTTPAKKKAVEDLTNADIRKIEKESDSEEQVIKPVVNVELTNLVKQLEEKNRNLTAAIEDVESELAEVKGKLHVEKKQVESLMFQVAGEREKTRFYEIENKKMTEAMKMQKELIETANRRAKVFTEALKEALS